MYDVIVIGARCAGAPTAMLLARQGHRVLLLDKAQFPSDTLSTHLVKPRGMAYLRRWGLRGRLTDAGTPVQQAFTFTREGICLSGMPAADALHRCLAHAHGMLPEEPQALPVEWACVRRRVLDAILVEAAASAGAEVRERFLLEEVLFEGGRVVGVRGRVGQSRVEERAQVVIGADGRRSTVARQVQAPVIAERPRCTFTAYSYYAGIDTRGLRMPVHLRGRLGVGFGPTNDGLTLISVFGPREWWSSFSSDMEQNLLWTVRFCYPKLEEAMRSGGRREERLHGTVDMENVLRRAHGPGWLLVGDAGCHLDQCTAIGITHAFRDAELAACAIHRGMAGEAPMDEALADYDARRLEEITPQFEYVSTVAECNPPSWEQLQMLAALGKDPGHAARFLGFGASIVPRAQYFSAAEIQALVSSAGAQEGVPTREELAERVQQYQANPWG
jgi:flavin-dependent dehydrogenase